MAENDRRLCRPQVLLISGAMGSGKTTVCARVVDLARGQKLAVTGLLSLPRLAAGQKVGIDVQNVATGQRCPLAEAITDPTTEAAGAGDGPATQGWRFHNRGLDWGRDVLSTAVPCDMLIIDELGPLELLREVGWTIALDVLCGAGYRLAVVVVRPELVGRLSARLTGSAIQTFTVTYGNRNDLPRRVLDLMDERNEPC